MWFFFCPTIRSLAGAARAATTTEAMITDSRMSFFTTGALVLVPLKPGEE
jgi:hypothetical protein